MNRKFSLQLLAALSLASSSVFGFAATNYDIAVFDQSSVWDASRIVRPDYFEEGDPLEFKVTSGASVEYGFDGEGRDKDNNKVDINQIFSPQEGVSFGSLATTNPNVQAFLAQFNAWIPAANINGSDAASNPSFKIKSSRDETDLTLWSKLALPIAFVPGQLEIGCYLPVKFVSMNPVQWTYSGPTAAVPAVAGGSLTTEQALAFFSQNTNLNLEKFSGHHLGDWSVALAWRNRYTQVNESLSGISLFAQAGLSIPSSKNLEAREVLGIPYGWDGAVGVPLSGAINLHFAKRLKFGVAADVMLLFNEDRARAIKILPIEGDIINTNVVNVNRDPGHFFRLSVLAEGCSSCRRFSLGGAYQFGRKSSDILTSEDAAFNKQVVDQSEKWQDKNYHQLVVRGKVDFREFSDIKLAPTLTVSYKHPLKAKRMAMFKTICATASVTF